MNGRFEKCIIEHQVQISRPTSCLRLDFKSLWSSLRERLKLWLFSLQSGIFNFNFKPTRGTLTHKINLKCTFSRELLHQKIIISKIWSVNLVFSAASRNCTSHAFSSFGKRTPLHGKTVHLFSEGHQARRFIQGYRGVHVVRPAEVQRCQR